MYMYSRRALDDTRWTIYMKGCRMIRKEGREEEGKGEGLLNEREGWKGVGCMN